MLKIKVILGSTRPQRMSEKVGKWMAEQVKKKSEVEVEILDLREYPMPFLDEAIPPIALNRKYSNEIVQKWSAKIAEGDAFIVIAPEYNHGYPAVLKNAIDVLYSEWSKKPMGFVGYGSVAGARSIEQLRQVIVQLEMVSMQNSINIQGVQEAINVQGEAKEEKLNEYAAKFLDALIWWGKLLKNGREQL